jgi:hypothetical protein
MKQMRVVLVWKSHEEFENNGRVQKRLKSSGLISYAFESNSQENGLEG